MLGRVCAVVALAVLLVPTSAFPVVEEASASTIFNQHLRTYGFEGLKIHEKALLLSTAEDFTEYYWVLEAENVVTIYGEPQVASTGFVEVKRTGTDDIICRGAISEYNEIHKHQICSDLRVGHNYVVRYVLSTPGALELHGHEP